MLEIKPIYYWGWNTWYKFVNEDFDILNAIITEHTNDKKFIPFIEKLKLI